MNRKYGYICILITTLLFSSMEVASKFIADDFHPIQITFTRFFIAGLVLLPMARKTLQKRQLRLEKGDYLKMAALGFLGIFFSMTFYQLSILYIDASAVAVLFSCNPLFVTIFAVAFIGEKAGGKKIVSIIIELIGIVCIVQPWNIQLNILGIVFVLIAAASFALYGVLGKTQCAKTGGIVVTCGSFLLGSVEMMAVSALTKLPAISAFMHGCGLASFADIPFFTGYTAENFLDMAYLCLICTSVGYTCYFLAMEQVSAQTVSLVFFFKPVLAPVMAALILNESIPMAMVFGIVLILGSSLLSMAEERQGEAAVLPEKPDTAGAVVAEEVAEEIVEEIAEGMQKAENFVKTAAEEAEEIAEEIREREGLLIKETERS